MTTRITFGPTVYDITGYAGDTLPIQVVISDADAGGREWSAQVRADAESDTIDATFTIAPAGPDMGAYLYLSAADTARLGRYQGFYDVQLTPIGGGDPTTTIITGRLDILPDVTRPA